MIKQIIYILSISLLSIVSYGQEKKGQSKVGLTISLPLFNNFSYYDHELKKTHNTSGFGGLGTSIFYQNNNKNKFSFYIGAAVDFRELPVERFDGTETHNISLFFDLLYHKNIYRGINAIGGINFIIYRFNLSSYTASIPEYSTNDETLGLTTGVEYSFFKGFGAAVFYRPALVSFDRKQYRHTISLEGRYSINLRKK
jgi:hypothetical protein